MVLWSQSSLAGLVWCWLGVVAIGQSRTTKPSTLIPLFNSTANQSTSPLQTLHTSLYTLLPILPFLSPPPHHTLLTAVATQATKPLLLNWLCFLKHKAKWGNLPPGYPSDGAARKYDELTKVLIITGDEFLARDLAHRALVVWWVKGLDFDDEKDDEAEEDRLIRDDAFLNVRLLDLLLPGGSNLGGWQSEGLRPVRDELFEPGSLQFQSLMLERSLAVAALVGGLVESQVVDPVDRRREEEDWMRRVEDHDWEDPEEEPPKREEWVGVKGVLLADVDAVWLSNPSPFLSHPYRLSGSHPSFIHSVDFPPSILTPWNSRTAPSSSFLYTRVADVDAHHAAHLDPTAADAYSPASAAAEAWRFTALCHVAEVLKAFKKFHAQAQAVGRGQGTGMKDLHWGHAPGFAQASLGPAMFLAEQAVRVWPTLGHDEWADALRSGEPGELLELLAEVGIAAEEDPDEDEDDGGGESCLSLARRNYAQSPNPDVGDPMLTSLADPAGARWRPMRAEALPFDVFPPGTRYFGGGLAEGTRAAVVHANYGEAGYKEKLLGEHGLWALGGGEEEGWTCDVGVVARA